MGEGNIVQRKFSFCETLQSYDRSVLVVVCPNCLRLAAACCTHASFGGDWAEPSEKVCHHTRIAFTDGACSENGKQGARAGLGIVIGVTERYSWSIPVDDTVDDGFPRTSQRAELLAAIVGLKCLEGESDILPYIPDSGRYNDDERTRHGKVKAQFVIVSDSEYVVKGMTEWLPSWKARGWRNSYGKRPANLDLFVGLDDRATRLEQEGIEVGFWHIPREFNVLADEQAKMATRV
ncbi:ribonuclease H-like domain-containing protein [Lyophyllum atratum]|nr:ribonuclease H-like domain-containing protein [Lyophyllum atratum]